MKRPPSEFHLRRRVLCALIEALEPRTLLSAYTYSTIARFSGMNGSTPFGNDLTVDAQGDLLGAAVEGGAENGGVVFEISAGTDTITPIASFPGAPGPAYPQGRLLIDAAGNIFGTSSGGSAGYGTVYVIPHGTHAIATIATFDDANGAYPIGLSEDAAGNLYGVTQNGGGGGDGTVFEIARGSGTITVLATFNQTNGAVPEGNLLIDSAGNIFGTTEQGGAGGNGTIFEIPASAGTLTTLASFDSNGDNGSEPYGDLVMDSHGNLFGATQFGGISDAGPNSDGVVFELARGSGTITPLAEFTQDTGYNPFTGLVMDANGNMFGTTVNGGVNQGGTIFEIPAGTNTISVLASLPGPYGDTAGGGLAIDSAGNLFGMNEGEQIPADLGNVFELSPTQATHLAFSPEPAATVAGASIPTFSLEVLDSSGRIISSDDSEITVEIDSGPAGGAISGTTTVDAIGGVARFSGLSISQAGHYTLEATDGTLTAADSSLLNITPSPLTALASFDAGSGDSPSGNLVMDGEGNFYGATADGGGNGDGEIYELVRGAGTLTPLAAFSDVTGTSPVGALVMDASGDLFGVAAAGGDNGSGTIFELPAGSGTITALASFTGSIPAGGLVMDASGDLFGFTTTGGDNGDGTLFELAASSGTITTLASFAGITWNADPGPLVLDSAGDLFGATPTGGQFGEGSVFEFFASSQTLGTVASFSGLNGSGPQDLVADSAGNILGTTTGGGDNGLGTLFILPAGATNPAVLASFDDSVGSPISLAVDSAGNLWGVGGAGGGTIFESPADSGSITAIAALDSSIGTAPVGILVDPAGNLFGVAGSGGANGIGTVFRLALAPATHIAFTTEPVSVTADQDLADISVAVEDAEGYPVTADDSTITLTIGSGPAGALEGTLSATVQNGIATFSGLSLPVAGTYTLSASNGVLPIASSDSFVISPGMATQLAFEVAPGDSGAGAVGTLSVAVLDGEGNIVTGDQSIVTLSLGEGAGPLLGNASAQAVNGVATFSDLAIVTPGTYTLLAADDGLAGAATMPFVITPAGAAQLVFTVPPTSVAAGGLGTVVVAEEDPYGNLVSTEAPLLVSIGISSGVGKLNGMATAETIGGIADFTDLSIESAGTYTLTASAGGLLPVVSEPFAITPIAPADDSVKLVFSVQPAKATAGSALAPISVTIENSHGHSTNDDSNVTLSIASGPNGSELLGSYVVPAENGLATFENLSLQTAGTYTLFASDTTLGTATSARFIVEPAAPAQMAFQQNPLNAAAGATLSPAVTVAVRDAYGNLVTNSKSAITLAVDTGLGGGGGGGGGGAALRGTVSQPLKGGIATFRNLFLTQAGTYTLEATGVTLAATSQSFTITAAAAAKLVFVQQPTTAAPGANITPAITVAVEDRFGNVETGSSAVVTLSISAAPHGGSLTGVPTSAVQNGVALLDSVALSLPGTYKLKATGAGFSAVSSSFIVESVAGALPGMFRPLLTALPGL